MNTELALVGADDETEFTPAPSYVGPRANKAFRMGPRGTGYYIQAPRPLRLCGGQGTVDSDVTDVSLLKMLRSSSFTGAQLWYMIQHVAKSKIGNRVKLKCLPGDQGDEVVCLRPGRSSSVCAGALCEYRVLPFLRRTQQSHAKHPHANVDFWEDGVVESVNGGKYVVVAGNIVPDTGTTDDTLIERHVLSASDVRGRRGASSNCTKNEKRLDDKARSVMRRKIRNCQKHLDMRVELVYRHNKPYRHRLKVSFNPLLPVPRKHSGKYEVGAQCEARVKGDKSRTWQAVVIIDMERGDRGDITYVVKDTRGVTHDVTSKNLRHPFNFHKHTPESQSQLLKFITFVL